MPDVPYETQSPDTDEATEAFLFAAYRRMSPVEKIQRVGRLGQMVKSVVLAELRGRFPDATERELALRYASRMLDRETMRTVFRWDPDRTSC